MGKIQSGGTSDLKSVQIPDINAIPAATLQAQLFNKTDGKSVRQSRQLNNEVGGLQTKTTHDLANRRVRNEIVRARAIKTLYL